MIDTTETRDSQRERGRAVVDGNGGEHPAGWPMSTAELDESGLPEGVFHLLTADTDVASTEGGYVAVCGAVMVASGLPPSCYPEVEPGRDPRYCPECVREAARWSAEAGDRQATP